MVRGRFHCRVIALIAAYAIAFQALLTAFAPLALAIGTTDAFGVICSGAGTDPAHPPAGTDHDHCGPACLMAGCGLSAALPSVGATRVVLSLVPTWVGAYALPRPARDAGNPREARAPPRV